MKKSDFARLLGDGRTNEVDRAIVTNGLWSVYERGMRMEYWPRRADRSVPAGTPCVFLGRKGSDCVVRWEGGPLAGLETSGVPIASLLLVDKRYV